MGGGGAYSRKYGIYLWMSLKSPEMSWKVLESPGILNCGHHEEPPLISISMFLH